MSYANSIKVVPTHNDVFGVPAKSVDKIAFELGKYNSYAVLHLCSKLMLLLNSNEGTSHKVQGSMAAELLDQDSKSRLLQFLADHGESRLQFFHHVPVMMLLKINLERNDKNGKDISNGEDRALIASWLLSLSEMWLPNERAHKRGWTYFYEQLRIHQAKQFLQDGHDEIINLLARGSYMLNKVAQVKSLNFNSLFKETTGISVELYIEILFLAMTQWSMRTEDAVIEKIAVRSVNEFFSKADFAKSEIEAFMRLMSFSVKEYPDLKAEAMKTVKIKDDPQNFIVFINKPILTYEEYFICMSPGFLALKMTEGPYRIVEAALKGKSNENQLAAEWGNAYEAYVNERLAKAFKKTIPNIKTPNSELDNMVNSDAYTFMVETKYAHWTYAARITGSRDDMKKYLGRIARFKAWKPKPGMPLEHKKLGLGQIKQSYIDMKNDPDNHVSLVGKIVIPILVLGDGFPFDPINRKYFEDFAINQQCLIEDVTVLPFITLTSDELELIESFSEEFGEEYTTNLIAVYARSLNMKITRKTPVHLRPASLYNHFYATGKQCKNNKFLRSELDKLSKRVLKHQQSSQKKSS